MQFEDHPAPPPPTRGGPSRRAAALIAVAVALVLVAAVAAILTTRGGAKSTAPLPPQTASASSTTASVTTLEPQHEVVDRLREILRIRDRALAKRDAKLLDAIYTVDCNCLSQSRALIRQLRKEHLVWSGLSTSLQVQKVEKVNDRLWTVIGVLATSTARIEGRIRKSN
jgi:hypothetical protein